MLRFLKKTSKTTEQIVINNKVYKLDIYIENRKNSRVSITKTGINIRLDKRLSKKQQTNQLDKFILWAKNTIEDKGHVFEIPKRVFKHQEELCFYDKKLKLEIFSTDKKSVFGKINADKIQVSIPDNIQEEKRHEYLSKIISRLLVKEYKAKIEEKIHFFNNKFQLGEINQVKLKNNATNWGSCSSKNNINISIRLLLAPEFAVDYVIIHELCHLKHRNHSKHFWNLVAQCCPDYKTAEKWLKTNTSKCVI